MTKTLIMIGAGLETVPAIIKAKALGLRVVAVDADPNAPGYAHADEAVAGCVYTPQISVDALAAWARRGGRPDGVMCAAVDAPHTVAAVAEYFGLRAASRETAALATDKLAMKARLAARGIPVPWYQAVSGPQELAEIIAARPGTLIIKPVDSRGARGVLRLVPGSPRTPSPREAYDAAAKESPTGRVMVEAYLNGPQVSTEGLCVEGTPYTPGFSDRNYEFLDRFAPSVIENGGELPSVLAPDVRQAVKDLTGRAALALGIDHGVYKGDMVVHQGKPYVIEIAARLSGGYFCTHEIPWNTGVRFVEQAIRLAVGEVPQAADLTPVHDRGVAQRYLFAPTGTIARIEGVEQARAVAGVRLVELRVRPGARIEGITSHPARAGVVMAVADSRDEAVAAAEEAVSRVVFVSEPHP